MLAAITKECYYINEAPGGAGSGSVVSSVDRPARQIIPVTFSPAALY